MGRDVPISDVRTLLYRHVLMIALDGNVDALSALVPSSCRLRAKDGTVGPTVSPTFRFWRIGTVGLSGRTWHFRCWLPVKAATIEPVQHT